MDAPASSNKTAAQTTSTRSRADSAQYGDLADRKSDRRLPVSTNPSSPVAAAVKPAAKPSLKPLDIVVPSEIGRYTIGRKIGSGTCGVVHMALDNVLRREVAIKISPVGEAHVSTGKVPGAQRAYQTEIVAAGRLSHPSIVTVYDAGQYEDLNYLVMEAVDGVSLKKFGKGQNPLPIHRALEVIVECCRALDYSHSQDIIHRDVKPANIMLSEGGAVKVLDFGIAVGLTGAAGLSRKGPTLGTPNYMSPEQILGKELTASSDFYSLATVLFELLTSRQLFKAQKVKDLFRTVVHQVAPRLSDIKPAISSLNCRKVCLTLLPRHWRKNRSIAIKPVKSWPRRCSPLLSASELLSSALQHNNVLSSSYNFSNFLKRSLMSRSLSYLNWSESELFRKAI